MSDDLQSDSQLKELYLSYKKDFLNSTARYNLDSESRTDIYQDAFIALYQAVKKNVDIKKDIKNYLFGIGRHMIFDRIKKQKEERQLQADLVASGQEYTIPEDPALNIWEECLRKAIGQMSPSCRKILTLFYYRGYSIEAIMHSMNLRNENVTKSQKSRCLRQLKEMVKNADA